MVLVSTQRTRGLFFYGSKMKAALLDLKPPQSVLQRISSETWDLALIGSYWLIFHPNPRPVESDMLVVNYGRTLILEAGWAL